MGEGRTLNGRKRRFGDAHMRIMPKGGEEPTSYLFLWGRENSLSRRRILEVWEVKNFI